MDLGLDLPGLLQRPDRHQRDVPPAENPELVAERADRKEDTKDWDRRITRISASFWFLQFIVAGLDIRFGWTGGLPLWGHLVGAILLIAGNAFANWAMHTNAFFSTEVRIQEDRGRSVITEGPYQYVRHPGYTGFGVAALGLPLFLGSLWALLPTTGMVVGIISCAIYGPDERTRIRPETTNVLYSTYAPAEIS